MHRFTIPRTCWPALISILSLVLACGCRSIAPPAPKYDVEEPPAKADEASPKPQAKAGDTEASEPEPVAEIPVVASRTSLCEEPTVEMQAWDIEQGTDVDYTLCRADRPVEEIEVGYRWRHKWVEIDILKNPEPIDPNHDELNIFLTNVHEAPLEIRISCKAVAEDIRNEVCKRYQPGQMVNFDIECVGRAEVGASGDSYELAVTVSPAEGQATAFKFTAGPLTGDCGGD